ncbi:hypothetical protein ACGFI9_13495 [Micromonospora sp. NPDC048930]|uniref:hypothetical protein n=1 Tax=Micromonospora sp. NPDC048930 TaxID=3364261 RepID=UPI003722D088
MSHEEEAMMRSTEPSRVPQRQPVVRQAGRTIAATIALACMTVAMGSAPAAASTKLTCNTGFAGTCTTGSLYPYYNGPYDGIFYLGKGTSSCADVSLEVVQADNGFVHTSIIVTTKSTWHDYRGGFNPSKRYYLRVGGPGHYCEGIVGSIENRPLP